ncbi:MAG: PDZ domain-containing protein [Actinobacteria bacterium]|nr:PDZ domain-containing protein [Actinomycetota bacterium]
MVHNDTPPTRDTAKETAFVSVLSDEVTILADEPDHHRSESGASVETAESTLGFRRFFQGALAGALVAAVVAASIAIAFERKLAPGQERLDVQGVLEQIEPAVVRISIELSGTNNVGAGTGFIITTDGAIVTNAHVVENAQAIEVTLGDGRRLVATLLGADPTRDLAVLKIEVDDELPVATLGRSSNREVGDPVLAIGNALGLAGGPTVTTGIISALDRVVPTETARLTNVMQTDAAINPGNSGGPLVDRDGRVIGISTAIAGDAEGIGFAIAIDHARPVIELLVQGIVPTRPLLGVAVIDVRDLADDAQEEFGIDVEQGAVVTSLAPGEGAERAGLDVGDVITSFNGQPVVSSDDLVAKVRAAATGATVALGFRRDGSNQTATVELGELLGAGG